MGKVVSSKSIVYVFRLLAVTALVGIFVFSYVIYSSYKLASSGIAYASVNNSSLVDVSGFINYQGEELKASKDHRVVLVFKANWCSTCVDLENNINENQSKIPNNLTIVKIDFDKEFNLRKKYSVTLQHTLVQIDEDGKVINTTYLTSTLDKLIQDLK